MSISLKDIDLSQGALGDYAVLAFEIQEAVRAAADSAEVPDDVLAKLRRRVAEIDAGNATLITWGKLRARVFGRP